MATSYEKDLCKVNNIISCYISAVNTTSQDPVGAATKVSKFFACDGKFVTESAVFTGPKEIRKTLIEYGTEYPETDQHIKKKGIFWDPVKRLAFVPWLWSAVPTQDGIVKKGKRYYQDDFVVFVFNCDWEIIYYHERFNPSQTKSTLMYPFAGPNCEDMCGCN